MSLAAHHRYPKLRWPLDIRMESFGDRRALLIRCPLGIAEQPLLLVPEVAPVIACFAGALSTDEILQRFSAQGLTSAVLQQIVELLDQHTFLDSPAFTSAAKHRRESFAALAERPAALAGLAYPADQQSLANLVHGYITSGGPHVIADTRPLACLVAPHVDYHRGGSCYGAAYRHLAANEHDLLILLGTSHQYSESIFHLTTKHFTTPLGALPCDVDFVSTLAKLYGTERSFADEILHKQEHSLELQAPFLRHVGIRAAIAPILVGSFHAFLRSGSEPSSHAIYDDFAAALTATILQAESRGKRVGFMAGVDMAHVGAHFGDSGKLTPDRMAAIRERDHTYLDCVLRGDHHGLYAHIAEDNDARRICGFPTMYTILDVLARLRGTIHGKIFDYHQAINYENDCAVTFASLGLYR